MVCRLRSDAGSALTPPGVGKSEARSLTRRAAEAGYRTYFTSAADLAARLLPRGDRGQMGDHHAVLRRPDAARDRRTR